MAGWRAGRRGLAGVLSLVLAVTVAPVDGLARADEPVVPSASPSGDAGRDVVSTGADGLVPLSGVVTRPDWTSASVTARASGVPVEVLSERSETRRVFVHASGKVQEEIAAGPVRFRDAKASDTHGWRAIDTTLVKDASGVHATAAPGGVSLGGAGESTLVSAPADASGAARVTMALPGVSLPDPVLDGSTAVYRDVVPGVDARLEVRPAGFELVWQVNSAAGAAELVKRYGTSGVVSLPTAVTSTLPLTAEDGSLVVKDAKGKQLGRWAQPSVWDAKGAKSNGKGAEKGVKFAPSQVKKQRSSWQAPMAVQADAAWLTDTARVFPVTIDPTYAYTTPYPVFDTFVQQGYTTDQSTSSELKLGNNGSGQVARSYLNFDAAAFKGKYVTSASLSLFASHSWSCTARSWSTYDAGVASASTRWAAQPTIGAKRVSTTQTKGYSSSCPAGRVNVDMTAQAKAWSSTTAATVGMMLRADDETDPYGWKRFYSNDSSYRPVMTLNYDRAPGAVNTPTVSKSQVVNGKLYIAYGDPSLSVQIPSDADGNTVKVDFSRMSSAGSGYGDLLCTTGYKTSGTTASCVPSAKLADNEHAWLRARANDSMLPGGWSSAQEYWVTLSAPPPPTISCPTANNSWGDTVKAAESCTVTMTAAAATSNSAATRLRYSIDGSSFTDMAVSQPTTSAPTTAKLSMGGTAGLHTMTVIALSPVGRQSAQVSYSFGYGAPSITAPVNGQTTTSTVQVTGAGAPGTTSSSSVQWKVAGSPDTAYVATPASNTFTQSSTATGLDLRGLLDTSSLVGVADGAGKTVQDRVPTSIDVRVCFTYTVGGRKCSPARRVVRVPHAFGRGFPTSQAGPGQVALWTGELSVSESDADLPSTTGALSIGRSHTSFAGDVAKEKQVFGPGWVADLDGGDSGVSSSQVYDSTAEDGTIALVSPDGEALVYSAGARRTTASLALGTYTPADDDTASSGTTLVVAGTGTAPVLTFTDEDGVKTRFTTSTAPTATTAAQFAVADVTDPATPGKTTYQRNAAGYVTAIIAPLPTGVSSCVPGTPTAGCRVLKLTYDVNNRVTQVTAQVDTAADKVLSTYTYNTDGTMASQTDAVTGLVTKYTWTGSAANKTLRLASITPPGQDAFQFSYANNKLDKVTRALPSTVSATDRTAQLAAFVYNQPTTVTDLNLGQFDGYQLPRGASTVFAVFGPDQKITGAPAANDAAWHRATVYLTDGQGYTIHSGSYGAGAWQLDANVYDDHDNVVTHWDARATEQLRAGNLTDITTAATQTDYNPDWKKADGTVVTPAGTLVTKVTGPARWMTDQSGTRIWARQVTDTTYDNGDPAKVSPDSGQPYRLVTKTVASTITEGDTTWATHDVLSTTLTSYDGLATDGTTTGWKLGQPTAVTTDMDGSGTVTAGDITRETVYDAQGRVVQQRQPSAQGKAADPGTRVTTYYTAGNNVAACQKTEWIGLTCTTGPGAGTQLPVEKTLDYTWDQQAATTQTVNGAAQVTTTTTFDTHMRPVTVTTTSSGLTGSTAVPAVTTSYDANGQVTGTTSSAGATSKSWDSWGRQIGYSNTPTGQATDSSTITYDALGQVIKTADGNGSTDYVYDGTDANGQAETRGLVTKVTQTTAGQSWSATAAYDSLGQPTTEKLPGGIIRRHSYDPAGELVDLSYSGKGTDPDTGQAVDDQDWFGWSAESDAAGRTTHEWAPTGGSAYESGAVRSDRTYSYDKAGRLVGVDDLTGNDPDTATCQRRTYGFDVNGNRTSQATASNTAACADTGATSTTRAYDAADRPVTGANGQGSYVTDLLGRQTSIPASDTANPGNGDMALAYYDTDTAKSVTQGDVNVTWSLDGAGRRLTQTTSQGSVVLGTQTSSSLVRHYTDESDNPTWSVDTASGVATSSRYLGLTGDGLGLTVTTTGSDTKAVLDLAGLRGDVVASTSLTGTEAATGIDLWGEYTEYGTPTGTTQPGIGYGWLGSHERATLALLGITLMGARLYNQATGLFTSLDPQYQGGDTAYGYPNDPINSQDLDGNSWWKRAGNWTYRNRYAIAREAALTFLPGGNVVRGVVWARRAYKVYRGVRNPVSRRATVRAAIWVTRNSNRMRSSYRTFHRGSFPSSFSSFAYHYGKHGSRYGNPSRYMAAARYHQRRAPYGVRKIKGRGLMHIGTHKWASFF
ncbi:DNRLRE domain-containing protein [Cutibacterium avidum]|uniref:DNRLRE domain-containing protein n=1 Tax=Cutibacterium avidum TaxID=33010 RepID=UPI00336C1910